MWFKLTGANFSDNCLGTMDSLSNSWSISTSLGSGASYSGVKSVSKGASFSATVTIATGYELGSAGVTVTMGGVTQSGAYAISGSTITISIASVTGNVVITVPTVNASTGEEDSDISSLFTFDLTSSAWNSELFVNGSSGTFDSTKTDVSSYAGKTVKITFPKFTSSSGGALSNGMLAMNSSGEATLLQTMEKYTEKTSYGKLETYIISLPNDIKYLCTSIFSAAAVSGGKVEGDNVFSCIIQ